MSSVYINGINPQLILYATISYPLGTAASLSSTAQVVLHLLSLNNIQWVTVPAQTYNFNAQFQLVSVYQGTTLEEQLTYDNGGNCLADSMYNRRTFRKCFATLLTAAMTIKSIQRDLTVHCSCSFRCITKIIQLLPLNISWVWVRIRILLA